MQFVLSTCMGETDLSNMQKEEAEFWAWLTEGHTIPEPLTLETVDKTNRRFRVITTDEIKQLIIDSLEKKNERLSDELLRIASESQSISSDVLRKSMRTRNGEYLKLLYVKILEKTSSSNVIVKLLTPYIRNYLESFKKQWGDKLKSKNQRLDYLISLVEKWPDIRKSRSRVVDIGGEDYETGSDIMAYYPWKLEDIKAVISDFILTELERKLFGDYSDRSNLTFEESIDIFQEFRKRWNNNINENFRDMLYLKASIDKEERDKVLFIPQVLLPVNLIKEDKESLFERFGERNVIVFLKKIRKMHSDIDNKKDDPLPEYADGGIIFNIVVNLPSAAAHIISPDSFEVDPPSKTLYLNVLSLTQSSYGTLLQNSGIA